MIRKILTAMVVLCIASLGACGGGSSSTATSSTVSTVSLTGTVSAPAVASGNIAASKGFASKAVADAAAASVECKCYSMDGELLGTGTTDASGAVTIDVPIDELRGDEDAGASSFSEDVVLIANDGELASLAEVTVTVGETTTVDIGAVNSDTTLAALAIEGFDLDSLEAGTSIKDLFSNVDMKCIFEAQKALFENSALDGEGMADDNAIIKESIKAFMASGSSPEDAGYSSWGEMLGDVMAGTAADKWSSIANVADDYIDDAYVSTINSGYETAASAFGAFNTSFASQFGASGYGMTALNIAKAEAASGSVCDSIKSGALDPAALVLPMLAADDIDSFAEIYGSADGFAVHIGLIEECMAKGNCADLIDKPGAYFGFMDSYGGDFSSVWNGSALDSTEMEGMFYAAGSCTGATWEDMSDCSKSMYQTVYNGAGDWSSYMTDGDFDPAKFESQAGYWMGQVAGGFDPDSGGTSDSFWDSAYSQMQGMAGSEDDVKECVDALIAAGIYDTTSCYGNSFDNFNELGGYSGTEDYTASGSDYEAYVPEGYTPPSGGSSGLSGLYSGSVSGCPAGMGSSAEITGIGPYTLGPLSISWTSGSTCTATGGAGSCSACSVIGSGDAGTMIGGSCSLGSGAYPNCQFSYTKQ